VDPLRTSRLLLVPADDRLVGLEQKDRAAFFRLLGVEPVDDWPSDSLRDALPFFTRILQSTPEAVGWLSWYWILEESGRRHLVGGGGFKGLPSDIGAIEIGYEVRPECRQQGFATEAVTALVAWALSDARVCRVIAETSPDNQASIGVLLRAGFVPSGAGSDTGLPRYERRRE